MDRNFAEKLLKAQEYADKAGRLNLVHSIIGFIRNWGAAFAMVVGITTAVEASKGNIQQAEMLNQGIKVAVGGGVALVGSVADEIVRAKADMYGHEAERLADEIASGEYGDEIDHSDY